MFSRIMVARPFILTGAALIGLLMLAAPRPTAAQGCALCYTQAASSGSRMIQALKSGILILIAPPTLLSVGIASGHELLEERLIVASTGEIAAPAKHQGLVDGLLEAVMTLLDVAILVGLSRLDRLGFEAVVLHQGLVSPSEHLGLWIGVDRRGQAIGAVPSRNSSQFPQGVLQPFAEALEALGEADRAGLPVGVGQHEMIDQVIERFAGDAACGGRRRRDRSRAARRRAWAFPRSRPRPVAHRGRSVRHGSRSLSHSHSRNLRLSQTCIRRLITTMPRFLSFSREGQQTVRISLALALSAGRPQLHLQIQTTPS